ncbi:MAG: 50S ribosomal protein L15 [Bdellovibrionales bacterium]|nr:50S ribosomal protein L15 [Bdellovibrionales bacterium]
MSNLSPNKGSRKRTKRIGRGEASGWGKTSGRGAKGQLARTGGKVREGFEGGQTPLYRRIPKWGFFSRTRILGWNIYNTINLNQLDSKFSDGDTVDLESLKSKGLGTRSRLRGGVKVLGSGKITKKLTVKVHSITKAAKAAIESAGGSVEIIEAANSKMRRKAKKAESK